LKTRRNFSFASQAAGVESAEPASKQAAPANKKNRKKNVLVITFACNHSTRR